MKLNQKTSRLQLLVLLLVMPIGGVAMFFGLRYFFEGEVDEKLLMDEIRITNYLKKSRPVSLEDITYECQVVDDSISPLKSYSKGFVKDLTGGGRELFKSLTVIKNIDGVNYRIVLHEPVLENKDFIYVIVMTIAIFLVTSFILFLLLFYKVQSAVWAPFFKSLNSLKKFSLGDSIVPKYDRVAIEEFDSLNKELTLMTEKIVSDYKILREFSENAAHETQTPLAIISLEIDELLQIDLPMEVTQRLYNIFQGHRCNKNRKV